MAKRPRRRKKTPSKISGDARDIDSVLDSNQSDPGELRRLAHRFVQDGKVIDALRMLDRIIELDRAGAKDWKQTGQLLCSIGEFAQGADALRRSVEADDSDAEAWHDCGRAHYKLGLTDRAAEDLIESAKRTSDLSPYLALATLAPGVDTFDNPRILHWRREFAKRLSEHEPSESFLTGGGANIDRARIGFVSSWFDKENYMKPVWALINELNRDRYEIHLFDDCDSKQTSRPRGYQPYAGDRWQATASLDNLHLARQIARQNINILVDLNAYSTPLRLGLFNHRCAPIQAAWFNMYATSGLPEMDYIIGDHAVVDGNEDPFYSEKVTRLEQSYLTFTVTHAAPPIVSPPVTQKGRITFGSLVTLYKITPTVIETWAKILQCVNDAQLLIGNADLKSKQNQQFLLDCFAKHQIDPKRLIIKGPAPHDQFLRYYDEIDIALDAFPYNGGTTTMEAIWQGVPVVTYRGDRWASRTSASLLRGTHLERYLADDRDGYIETAVRLANHPDRNATLSNLRQTTRERLISSPVCDASSFARGMESVFDSWL